MKNTTKNIKTILQLFGYEQMQRRWFITKGSGILIHPDEAFRPDFYMYALCISGSARLKINNENFTVKPNSFLAAIPSTIVQVLAHSKNFKAKVLVFERGFLLKNILDTRQLEHLGFFNFHSLAFVPFTTEEAQLLGGLLDNLHDKSLKQSVFHNEIMQSLIFNLLFETADIYARYFRQKRERGLYRDEELFMQFSKLLQANFTSQRALSFYAQKLFISEKYLISICKKVSGKTPGTLLAEAVIDEAKLLLARADNNVGMVSDALGFPSLPAFSRFFKKHAGVTPSLWQ